MTLAYHSDGNTGQEIAPPLFSKSVVPSGVIVHAAFIHDKPKLAFNNR